MKISICIKGIGIEDSIYVSHGVLMTGLEPVIFKCESLTGEIYRISETWIIRVGEREYRVGEEGDVVVNKFLDGLYYTGLISDEMIGFITSEKIDDRVFVGMLAGFLSKGLSLNNSVRSIAELYEYHSRDPSNVVWKRLKLFKCIDRIFNAIDRLTTHSLFSKSIYGDVLLSCAEDGKVLYEIELYFDKNFRAIVKLSKSYRILVKEGVAALLCFEHPFGKNLVELEFNGNKWFCFMGEDPVKLVVELEKSILEKS